MVTCPQASTVSSDWESLPGSRDGPKACEEVNRCAEIMGFLRRSDTVWQQKHQFDICALLLRPHTDCRTRNHKRKMDDVHEEEEGHAEFDQNALREHEEFTKVKNVERIELGRYEMETWYFSPLPPEYNVCKVSKAAPVSCCCVMISALLASYIWSTLAACHGLVHPASTTGWVQDQNRVDARSKQGECRQRFNPHVHAFSSPCM